MQMTNDIKKLSREDYSIYHLHFNDVSSKSELRNNNPVTNYAFFLTLHSIYSTLNCLFTLYIAIFRYWMNLFPSPILTDVTYTPHLGVDQGPELFSREADLKGNKRPFFDVFFSISNPINLFTYETSTPNFFRDYFHTPMVNGRHCPSCKGV